MVKQAKGFSLNLGPVKKELLDFAQGFGVLTTQLGQFMQTMGNVQRASQGFGANPLFGQIMNTPNQGTGYQTPVGMQAQAAAQQAGWVQQPSYQERFQNLYGAARSSTPIHELALNQADQAIVQQSREAVRRSTEAVRDINRTTNAVQIRPNEDVAAGAAQGPIVRALVEDMRASGMSPAQAALEVRRISPDAASTMQSLGGGGFMRQARMEAGKSEEELQAAVDKQRAISQARRAARAMPDQSQLQAEREAKLEDIRIQNLKQGFNVQFHVGQTARTAMTRAAVTGDESYKYGLGDIVQAKGVLASGGKDQEALKAFTDKLKASTDALDRGLGMELDKMSGRFDQLSKKFSNLNDELQKQEVGSERYNKILAELARTGGELVQVDKDRKEASEQGGGPGGGEGGGGPSMRQRMARGFQTFQAVAGIGLGVAELGFGISNSMVRQNLGAERRALSNEAELNQLAFQRKREASDMTSVENRLKYRGDLMLSPNQLKGGYLGEQGQGKALETALKETLGTLKQEDRETMQKLITGGLRMGLGMTAAVGGALTSETGLGIMAGAAGVHQMIGGAQQVAGAYSTESANLQHGGFAGTMVGRMLGGTDEMVQENRREALMGVANAIAKRTEEIQNADVQRHTELLYGLQGREAARQTKIEGAALVGPYAVSGMESAQKSIDDAIAEGEKVKVASLDDASRAFRRVSELTHGQAVGGVERYAGEKVGNVAKDAMLFTMQGLESSFGKYTDTKGLSSAAGAYQMLGVVGLKGYEYAKQKNPNLTRAEFDKDPYAQTDAMAKILDDYNPSFFKKAAPGIPDAAALLIEHKQGINATGAEAARAYMAGKPYYDQHGANVTEYVKEGMATYEIQKRRLELKRLGQGDLSENQMAQMGASMMGAPMALSQADAAIRERKDQLRREIEERTQALGAGIAGANTPMEYMNRQLLASRRSDEAVDKYFNERKDIALDPASRFGMTYAEFGRHQNIVSNFIGTDAAGRGRAGAAMTSELIGMSRGGLGSFESLMGNLQGLNQARGGQNNMDALRDVMASAVTAGFDKSRTAQQFVTSVTSLAQSMDVTNTQDLSERMAAGALMMGATPGVGDERSMMLAQRGIQEADRFTGQTTGYVGANKLNALVGAGATMGTGLAIMQKMTYSQTSAGLRELDQANSLSDIKQEDVRALVGQYSNFAEGKKKVQAQLAAAAKAERESAFTSMRLFGKDPEKELEALRKMSPSDRIKEAGRIINEAYVQGSGTTLGSSGAAMMTIDKLREMNLITGRDADRYQRRYNDGLTTATDVAKQEKARFDNQENERASTTVKKANADQLEKFFGENGVLRNQAGATVTAEQYKKYAAKDAEFMASAEGKRVEQQIKSTTTEDLGLARRGRKPTDEGGVEGVAGFLGPQAAAALGTAIGAALSGGPFGNTMSRLTTAIEQLNGKLGSMGTKGLN